MSIPTRSARSNGLAFCGLLSIAVAVSTAVLLAEDRTASRTQSRGQNAKAMQPVALPAGVTPAVATSTAEAPTSPAVENADPSSRSESILLLRTGRLMRGKISRQTTNFIVAGDTGDVFVPGTLVEFWGANLAQIKGHMEAVLAPDGTPDQRVEFARWCVTQNLLADACDQLREALLLAPDREDIRRSLEKTELLLGRPVDPNEQVNTATDSNRSSTLDGKSREGLGGLAKHDARQYIVRIQPILMRNCAIAGCHAGENAAAFSLHRMGSNSFYRHLAAENVETLKKYIDINEPENSPLLTVSRRDHGKAGRVAFDYRQGTAHFEALQQWVESVSDFERHQMASKTRRQTTRNAGGVHGGNGTVQTAGHNIGTSPSGSKTAGEPGRYESDPFDPAEFNALVSGRRRSE